MDLCYKHRIDPLDQSWVFPIMGFPNHLIHSYGIRAEIFFLYEKFLLVFYITEFVDLLPSCVPCMESLSSTSPMVGGSTLLTEKILLIKNVRIVTLD